VFYRLILLASALRLDKYSPRKITNRSWNGTQEPEEDKIDGEMKNRRKRNDVKPHHHHHHHHVPQN
jgi:hypothetical protein